MQAFPLMSDHSGGAMLQTSPRSTKPTGPAPGLRPVAAVIAVVPRGDQVLLVRRANPPDAGLWGFPGGKVDAGETIAQATLRELAEETGVTATPGPLLDVLDIFDRDATGQHLVRHYVLVVTLCHWQAGEPVAADDALDAGWFTLDQMRSDDLSLSEDVLRLATLAVLKG